MLSVPLIMSYAVGFAVIKYHEGFVIVPGHGGMFWLSFRTSGGE